MALLNKSFQRRSFLKGGVAATAAIAAAGLAACAPGASTGEGDADGSTGSAGEKPEGLTPHEVASDVDILEEKGEWITAACPWNCGGVRCVNQVYVVDGVPVRQRTAEDTEDSAELPQLRSCPRGRAQWQSIINPDRIKYPMKRKNWQPGGDPAKINGDLRGIDEWERISWEEALDITASEMQRIYDTYGGEAVLNIMPSTYGGPAILNLMGGSLLPDETKSYGSWTLGLAEIGLNFPWWGNYSANSANDRTDLANAEMIALHGVDSAWISGGNPSWYYRMAREAGVEFVYIGPNYPQTASLLDARWIQVRPGGDTAFLMAVIFEMLRLDEEKGDIIDWDFMHKYTVGFDAESMPADAALDENLKDYILGAYDGIPKTPEWATEICGTPVEDITWYAEAIGKNHNVMLHHSYAASRFNGAEDLPQLFICHGFLGGHAGKPGNATGSGYSEEGGDSGDKLVNFGAPSAFGAGAVNPIERHTICGSELWESLLEGKFVDRGIAGFGNAFAQNFMPEQEVKCDLKMIYGINMNQVQTTMNSWAAVQVHRKCEFVVTAAYSFTFGAQLSDIVLPILTTWEGNIDPAKGEQTLSTQFPGLVTNSYGRDHGIFPSPVILPLYEAKSGNWIDIELMKRLGLDWEAQHPISEVQGWFDTIAGSTVAVDNATDFRTLVTITQEDIDEWGVVGTPQEGLIPMKELLAKGYYQVPRKAGDNLGALAYSDYIADPEANPRTSASGKFEIYCQARADKVNSTGYPKEPLKPYPTYREARQSYKDSFANWETKEKGELPFQLYEPHYLRRAHTGFDNSVLLQEALKNPVFLNAEDAKEKGIANGDTVIIWNSQGKLLRQASLLNTMMRGVVALPHGPRTDFDFETGIDRAGNEEAIGGRLQMSEWYPQENCYNSTLVDFAKYDGDAIPEDAVRDPFVPLNEEE
ncbi:molybdopterin-dependent oxidoreductase [Slackia heliotrinireducens]|uniref:molybdopterin-dependent oxidoreductase n=1 Tax=Slackia heliotrinireducens TaxID=84110 RepID=UPI0033152D16